MNRFDDIVKYYFDHHLSDMNSERFWNIYGRKEKMALASFEERTKDNSKAFFGANLLFDMLHGQHMSFYAWNLLYNNKVSNQPLCDYLALSSSYLLTDLFESDHPIKKLYVPLQEQGVIMLNLMACDRFDIIKAAYPAMMNAVQNGELFRSTLSNYDNKTYTGVLPDPQKMGVLAYGIAAAMHNQQIDWDSMGLPNDRFYVDFVKEALNSTDEKQLSEWLTELCDNHLRWCARPESRTHEDESGLLGYEIDKSEVSLWPFEYQAVKNYRRLKGLSTPDIDHPLLKTPMAIEHRADFSQWKAPEWFFPLWEELAKVEPKVAFVPALFKS